MGLGVKGAPPAHPRGIALVPGQHDGLSVEEGGELEETGADTPHLGTEVLDLGHGLSCRLLELLEIFHGGDTGGGVEGALEEAGHSSSSLEALGQGVEVSTEEGEDVVGFARGEITAVGDRERDFEVGFHKPSVPFELDMLPCRSCNEGHSRPPSGSL